MSLISLLLNLLWIVCGGLWMALGWVIAAVSWRSPLSASPGQEPRSASPLTHCCRSATRPYRATNISAAKTGPLGLIGNIVWLILAGWWLALGHIVTAILLALTIVGIPFAWAHLKLAGLALWPIGKAIVPMKNAPLR
jgi:uncharacterized membrane protein YccF (DUF307 family)